MQGLSWTKSELDCDTMAENKCIIDDSCFDIPSTYSNVQQRENNNFGADEEDILLQYALQKSLKEQRLEESLEITVSPYIIFN